MGHPWWHPNTLRESEKAFRQINDLSKLDLNNDFGSYRKALINGLENSNIESHNVIHASGRVRWICKTLGITGKHTVLDAGCGLGFTAAAIRRYLPESSVLGVDVSSDAVTYARHHFPNVEFRCEAIDPQGPELGKFSLIFCFEFYPFTRNADAEVQAAFLTYFAKQLTPTGNIVIFQRWDNPESLSAIRAQVERLSGLRFNTIQIPHPKMPSVPFALAISKALGILLRRDIAKRLLVITCP